MNITSAQGKHYGTEARMEWGDRVLLHLPDGSLLTIETDPQKGVTYLLATTTLGHKLPLVEVMGDVHTLPEASVHKTTGELVNKHEHASAARIIFYGGEK